MRSIIRGLTVAGALGLATISIEAQGGPPAGRPAPPDTAAGQARPGMPMRGQMQPGGRGQFGPGAMRGQMQPGGRGQFGPGAFIRGQAMQRGPAFNRRAQRDRMVARRAVARERARNLTPEQRQAMQAGREALRVERQSIGEQLRAGTLTREQARERLQAWRAEHQPSAALRGSRPPGEGY